MGNLYIIILYIFLYFHAGDTQTDIAEYTDEACYGITHDDFLKPRCKADEILYVYDVYTYAKQLKTLSYGCVEIRTTQEYNESLCCSYVSSNQDCGMRYYGSELQHYCVGGTSCKKQVAWNITDGECDQNVYFKRTHYMKAFYHCIPANLTTSICDSGTLHGNPLFIWSLNYPLPMADCTMTSGCLCRVSTADNTSIIIKSMDLRLYGYVNGNCSQRLRIIDGSYKTSISCSYFNAFKKTTIYRSRTNQLIIRLDNVLTTSGGVFWIALTTSASDAELSLSCTRGTPLYGCKDSFADQTTILLAESSFDSNSLSSEIMESTTMFESTNVINFTLAESAVGITELISTENTVSQTETTSNETPISVVVTQSTPSTNYLSDIEYTSIPNPFSSKNTVKISATTALDSSDGTISIIATSISDFESFVSVTATQSKKYDTIIQIATTTSVKETSVPILLKPSSILFRTAPETSTPSTFTNNPESATKREDSALSHQGLMFIIICASTVGFMLIWRTIFQVFLSSLKEYCKKYKRRKVRSRRIHVSEANYFS